MYNIALDTSGSSIKQAVCESRLCKEMEGTGNLCFHTLSLLPRHLLAFTRAQETSLLAET